MTNIGPIRAGDRVEWADSMATVEVVYRATDKYVRRALVRFDNGQTRTLALRVLRKVAPADRIVPADRDPLTGAFNPETQVQDPLTGEWHTRSRRRP